MTGRDAERDAVLDDLAFVLHDQGCGEVCVCVDDARALLPVVDRIATERAAAELRAAADTMPCFCENAADYGISCPRHGTADEHIRERADHLDPS